MTKGTPNAPSSRLGFASFTKTSAASSITMFMNSSKPCVIVISHTSRYANHSKEVQQKMKHSSRETRNVQ